MIKKILIVLGAIVALQIGGCALLIGWGVWEASQMPDYINKESLSATYGDDIEKIYQALKDDISLKWDDKRIELSEAILAVFTEINSKDVDLYERYDSRVGSKFSSSGAGRASITLNGRTEKCMTYDLMVDNIDYLVCIRDPQKESNADQ